MYFFNTKNSWLILMLFFVSFVVSGSVWAKSAVVNSPSPNKSKNKYTDSFSVVTPENTVVDLTSLAPGEMTMVEWHRHAVLIYRRTKQDIEALQTLDVNKLIDPEGGFFINLLEKFSAGASDFSKYLFLDQPKLDKMPMRSFRKEYFISFIHSTLWPGCSVSLIPKNDPDAPGEGWDGGFKDPCNGELYDFAGRAFKGNKSEYNLYLPPHQYVSEKKVIIGVGEPPRKLTDLDFDLTDYSSLSPDLKLLRAAYMGKFWKVEEAIKEGANPNFSDSNGNTALIYATSYKKDYIKMNKLILNSGANPNIVNRFGGTALYQAIFRDKLDLAELLIERGAIVDPICAGENCSISIMCGYAIPNRRKDVVRFLLQKGANPEARDRHGETPVECAREWEKRDKDRGIKAMLENAIKKLPSSVH